MGQHAAAMQDDDLIARPDFVDQMRRPEQGRCRPHGRGDARGRGSPAGCRYRGPLWARRAARSARLVDQRARDLDAADLAAAQGADLCFAFVEQSGACQFLPDARAAPGTAPCHAGRHGSAGISAATLEIEIECAAAGRRRPFVPALLPDCGVPRYRRARGQRDVDAVQHASAFGSANSTPVARTASGPGGDGSDSAGSRRRRARRGRAITLRQPTIAVWVWSRISLNSAMGSGSGSVRNRNATTSLTSSPNCWPLKAATTVTEAITIEPNTSPSGNMIAKYRPARMWAL